jgi:hypothetical protein
VATSSGLAASIRSSKLLQGWKWGRWARVSECPLALQQLLLELLLSLRSERSSAIVERSTRSSLILIPLFAGSADGGDRGREAERERERERERE